MALADFEPITETIQVKSKKGMIDVTLRGLGLKEIHQLITKHGVDMEGIFRIYEENAGPELSVMAVGKFAAGLVSQAPGLVSHIVALAADEPDAVDVVTRMGMMDQIKLIRAVGTLTFQEIGSVKKLLAELGELRQQVVSS